MPLGVRAFDVRLGEKFPPSQCRTGPKDGFAGVGTSGSAMMITNGPGSSVPLRESAGVVAVTVDCSSSVIDYNDLSLQKRLPSRATLSPALKLFDCPGKVTPKIAVGLNRIPKRVVT